MPLSAARSSALSVPLALRPHLLLPPLTSLASHAINQPPPPQSYAFTSAAIMRVTLITATLLGPHSCLVALVAQAALTAALGLALGPAAALLHGAVCAVLLTYMSVLDYVLHYGLRRPPLVVAAAAAATAGGVGGGADAAVSTVADSREVTGVAPAAAGVAAAPAAGSGAVRYAPVTPFNSWSSLYPLEVRVSKALDACVCVCVCLCPKEGTADCRLFDEVASCTPPPHPLPAKPHQRTTLVCPRCLPDPRPDRLNPPRSSPQRAACCAPPTV